MTRRIELSPRLRLAADLVPEGHGMLEVARRMGISVG